MNVEVVQQYCYLGIVFSASGNFGPACKSLYDKALKAFFKFKQLQPKNNAQLAIKLFDMLVFPIISYAGVVWGPLLTDKITHGNFMNVCDKAPIERLNIRFCKYLLGVHKFASNAAVKGELGRYPLLIKILQLSAKFHSRIETLDDDSLVKLSYQDTVSHSESNKNIYWCQKMTKLKTLFLDLEFSTSSMENQYRHNWKHFIDMQALNDSKLSTYAQIKHEFGLENYIAQFPLQKRRNLTKFRISAHQLAIETGRYTKPCKTPRDMRLCFHCGKIENESHLIFDCELYCDERANFTNSINQFSSLKLNPEPATFIKVMSSLNGDLEFSEALCSYINACFSKRKSSIDAINIGTESESSSPSQPAVTRSGRVTKKPRVLDL